MSDDSQTIPKVTLKSAPQTTTLYQLVQAKLGKNVMEFIVAARTKTDSSGEATPDTFRQIAKTLSDATELDVTDEAIRRWYTWYLHNTK